MTTQQQEKQDGQPYGISSWYKRSDDVKLSRWRPWRPPVERMWHHWFTVL